MALASLPGTGPGWLADLLGRHAPEEAWDQVLAGAAAPARTGWAGSRVVQGSMSPAGRRGAHERFVQLARTFDVRAAWDYCLKMGLKVAWPGSAGYPTSLERGPGRPGVLFWVGDISWVERCPVVAVVGTRRCTPEGAQTAYEMARELASAGVCVVSGLALGIDGAAHAGALAGMEEARERGGAATVGVAASGADVVYPRQHAALWRRLAGTGAVMSETPPRRPAQPWRFPARNRVVAGLSQMVVVVECHLSGGSWHTVDAALRWGVEVGAVPGPVRSPASDGTNMMIRDGATPVRSARDVLDSLGSFAGTPVPGQRRAAVTAPARAPTAPVPRVCSSRGGTASGDGAVASAQSKVRQVPDGAFSAVDLSPVEHKVLAAIGWRAVCLEDAVESSGLPVRAVALALARLEEAGALCSEGGWWWRVGRAH
jgi:DNA processing protein